VASARQALGNGGQENVPDVPSVPAVPEGSRSRLSTLGTLLSTALDSEEEYVYHGEMSDYMRSYAADAAAELNSLFRALAPSADEVQLCVQALSDPERVRRGRSRELLLRLREESRPIIDALSRSADPQVRIFALETGRTSLNPYFPDPLYGSIELNRQLLGDPDESVRAAAISTAQPTIAHNAAYLEVSLREGDSNPLLDFLYAVAARLDDPSLRVRAAAEKLLVSWAAEVGRETLERFAERADVPAALEVLTRASAPGGPPAEGAEP
jgi:hypothetical protein